MNVSHPQASSSINFFDPGWRIWLEEIDAGGGLGRGAPETSEDLQEPPGGPPKSPPKTPKTTRRPPDRPAAEAAEDAVPLGPDPFPRTGLSS